MKPFDVEKYFRKNPAVLLSNAPRSRIGVVIPAYDENENIRAALDSVREASAFARISACIIVVINYPANRSSRQSEELYALWKKGALPADEVIYLPELSGGVGAARKAGMDSFISGLPPEELEQSVIYSLDADTAVEPEYFRATLPEVLSGGAVSIPFSHRKAPTPQAQAAIEYYEAYMTRYVEKLAQAHSPYAFYTIGSAFAVRADSYIRAGGMKVREAGEDFYFLQAAAKSSGVRQLKCAPLVHPSPRISDRVPFGTGPAMELLLNGGKLNVIPDEAFEKLEEFLHIAASFEALSNLTALRGKLGEKTTAFLDGEGFFSRFPKVIADHRKHPERAVKAFHEWFDGLKTLKFLHFFSN